MLQYQVFMIIIKKWVSILPMLKKKSRILYGEVVCFTSISPYRIHDIGYTHKTYESSINNK
jgi:hypothetical protein